MKIIRLMIAATIGAGAAFAMPAAAVETVFANVTATGGQNFNFQRDDVETSNANFFTTSTPTGNVAGATDVLFSLSGGTSPLFQPATLLLSGSTAGDAVDLTGSGFRQQIDTFDFVILARNDFSYGPIDIAANDILLSGSVQNAALTGALGGTTGALNASTVGGASILFDPTPLLSFQPDSEFGLAFTLNSVAPAFGQADTLSALSSFRAQASGAFQSEPAPEFVDPGGAIPEPSTWAMMIVGMGLVGFARRRRGIVVTA